MDGVSNIGADALRRAADQMQVVSSKTGVRPQIDISGPAAAAALQIAWAMQEKMELTSAPYDPRDPACQQAIKTRMVNLGSMAYTILLSMHATAEGRSTSHLLK